MLKEEEGPTTGTDRETAAMSVYLLSAAGLG